MTELATTTPAPAVHPADSARRQQSDRALIRAARSGSEDAAEALVRRYWDNAVRWAFIVTRDAHGAEDIAQDSFLSAFRALDRFNLRRPFQPWLHKIVIRRSLDYVRSSSSRPTPTDSIPETIVGRDTGGIDDRIISAVATLEPIDRAIVVLRHVLGYRSAEIGDALDLPAATIRTRLRRALTEVRSQLDVSKEDSHV